MFWEVTRGFGRVTVKWEEDCLNHVSDNVLFSVHVDRDWPVRASFPLGLDGLHINPRCLLTVAATAETPL